jgi:hypothetical protein
MNIMQMLDTLDKEKLWYIATPYSKYHMGLEMAFIRACEISALFVKKGFKVFSPIAHTHPIAIHGNIDPLSHDIWIPFDETMMQLADGMVVCCLKGWDESKGVGIEIGRFEEMGKPIFYLSTTEA